MHRSSYQLNETCCFLTSDYLGCKWDANVYRCTETIVECKECNAYDEFSGDCCEKRENCILVSNECVDKPNSCEECTKTPNESECCSELGDQCALVDNDCIPTPPCWYCNVNIVNDREGCCDQLTPLCGWYPDGSYCQSVCSGLQEKGCCEDYLPTCMWLDTDDCATVPSNCYECNGFDQNIEDCCALVTDDCIMVDNECKTPPKRCIDCNQFDFFAESCCDQLIGIGCEYDLNTGCGSIIDNCDICNASTMDNSESCCYGSGDLCYWNSDDLTCHWTPICRDSDCCSACSDKFCCEHFNSPVKCNWLSDETCETRPESCSECLDELCCEGFQGDHYCVWKETQSLNMKQTECIEIEKCEDCEGSERCCETVKKDQACIYAGNYYDHVFGSTDPSPLGGFIQECYSPPKTCEECKTDKCCELVENWLGCSWIPPDEVTLIGNCSTQDIPGICEFCNLTDYPDLCCKGREDQCLYLSDSRNIEHCFDKPQVCTDCVATPDEEACCEAMKTESMECLWTDNSCYLPQTCEFCNAGIRHDPAQCCDEMSDVCCFTDDHTCVNKCDACNNVDDSEECCLGLLPFCSWWEEHNEDDSTDSIDMCYQVPDHCWECNRFDEDARPSCCVLVDDDCEWDTVNKECFDEPSYCDDCNRFSNSIEAIEDCCEKLPVDCNFDGTQCHTTDCNKCEGKECCEASLGCYWNTEDCQPIPPICLDCKTSDCCEALDELDQPNTDCVWLEDECISKPSCNDCLHNRECCENIMVDEDCMWSQDQCKDSPDNCEDCNWDWTCCLAIQDILGCSWDNPECTSPDQCNYCNFFEDPERCCEQLVENPDCIFVGGVCLDRPVDCWECVVTPSEQECCGQMDDCLMVDGECTLNPGGCRICDYSPDSKQCCEELNTTADCIFVDDKHCVNSPDECRKCDIYEDPEGCCKDMAEGGCTWSEVDKSCFATPELCDECNWSFLEDYKLREKCCNSLVDCMYNQDVCVPFPKRCQDCWQYPDYLSCCDDASKALQCITIGGHKDQFLCDSRIEECGECNVALKPISCCENREECKLNSDNICVNQDKVIPDLPPTCEDCAEMMSYVDNWKCCEAISGSELCEESTCHNIELPTSCVSCRDFGSENGIDLTPQDCCEIASHYLPCFWRPENFPLEGLVSECATIPNSCDECNGFPGDAASVCCAAVDELGCSWIEDSCGTAIETCSDSQNEKSCMNLNYTPGDDNCVWVNDQCNDKIPITCHDCNYARWQDKNLDYCCYSRRDIHCAVMDDICVYLPDTCEECDLNENPKECCDNLTNLVGCDWIDSQCKTPEKECTECNYYRMAEWCCEMQTEVCHWYETPEGSAACDDSKEGCEEYNDLDNLVIACTSDPNCMMEYGRCWNKEDGFVCDLSEKNSNQAKLIASGSIGAIVLVLGLIWTLLIMKWKLPYQTKNYWTGGHIFRGGDGVA